MTRALLLTQVFFLLYLVSCKTESSLSDVRTVQFNEKQLESAIYSNVLFADSLSTKALNAAIKDSLYRPLITSKDGLSVVREIINQAASMNDHGLPMDLVNRGKELNDKVGGLDTLLFDRSYEIDYERLADIEWNARTLHTDLARITNYGSVNPKLVFVEGFHLPSLQADSQFYSKLYTSDSPLEYFKAHHSKYDALQKAYVELKSSQQAQEVLPNFTGKIDADDGYAGSSILRRRFNLPAIADSLGTERINQYDSLLVEKVKVFQSRNGLSSDGVIGPATLKALNKTKEQKLNQIRASLERFRWRYNIGQNNLLLVNIPEYALHVYQNSKKVRQHRVCVGLRHPRNYYAFTPKDRPYEVRNYETPEFSDTLKYVVVNPKWRVPRSISRLEILPNLQMDPYYAVSHNYKIYDGSQELIAENYDWTQVNSEDFTYRVEQQSGSFNALGKIKFLFPNRYSVYLHDTPSKSHFNRDVRAVSHGCIRVENATDLGDFLMADSEKYKEYKKGEDEKSVIVDGQYEVMITYYTSWVDSEGNLQSRDDIYKKDAELLAAMSATVAS